MLIVKSWMYSLEMAMYSQQQQEQQQQQQQQTDLLKLI